MDINNLLPGSLDDPYTQTTKEETDYQIEVGLQQVARDLNFFQHISDSGLIAPVLPAGADLTVEPFAKIKQKPSISHIAGIVSATPQHIEVPDMARLMLVETSGRVWIGQHPHIAPNSTQTLEQASNSNPSFIIGNGWPKKVVIPAGWNSFFICAYPDNSEVSVSFYSGEVVLSDW